MKNILPLSLIVLLTLFFSCQSPIQPSETIERYYRGLNQSKYEAICSQLSDNFKVIEGIDTATYNQESYYNWFQWDSIFKPNYNIMDIKTVNDSLFVTLSKSCKRIDFLHDNPLIYTVHPTIELGKITCIETVSYDNADWNKWITRRDTLVASTAREHPEMKPFIYNQNKDGAMTYLKAIDLWLTGDKF